MSALDKIVEMFPNRLTAVDLESYRDESYKPRVKNVSEYRAGLIERMKKTSVWGDVSGFDALTNRFRFRPNEVSIWTGFKGHGKSLMLSQVVLGFMQRHRKVFIISPEFPPVELLYRMLIQILGAQDPTEEEADVMISFLSDYLWLYDVQASLQARDVAPLCRWVVENIKPDHIVIDSLMKCGLAPDDYAGQKRLVDQIQSVAHQNPVHIHLVAHARKQGNDGRAPNLHDVKGGSEIADMAENVIAVWRNKEKEKAASMGDSSKVGEPDAMFIIEAQRNCGGWIGTTALNFNPQAMIFFEEGQDFRRYVSIQNNEVQL